MQDGSFIAEINLTSLALTGMAIHHGLSAGTTGNVKVPPEFGPGGGPQCKCDTRNINRLVNHACWDVFRRLDVDFQSSSPEVQAKKPDNFRSMTCWRIHPTVTHQAMAQPYNNQGSIDEDFCDNISEPQIEQTNNSFNHPCSLVAATESSMQFAPVLPMGRSAITSSSQHIPSSNSNSNSNDITNITNITSIENTGLLDGSTIVEGAMSQGG